MKQGSAPLPGLARVTNVFSEFQQTWTAATEAERAALKKERSWVCPHCGEDVPPKLIEYQGQPVMLSFADFCGCIQEQQAEQAKADATRAAELKAAMSTAGLVGKLGRATFDSYGIENEHQAEQKAALMAYAQTLTHRPDGSPVKKYRWTLGDWPGLLLTGPWGTGKSHLAAAVVRQALEMGWDRVYYRSWAAYIKRLRASFEKGAKERTSAIEFELTHGQLVVIDDLDKIKPTEFVQDTLFNVIEYRQNRELPTILTSNSEPQDLVPWVGIATLDRIGGFCVQIEFKGESYRTKVAWQK